MAQDIETLAKELESPDTSIRTAAAEKLSSLGEDAAPVALALVRSLEDSDESVRELANAALEGCGPPPQETVDELEQLLASKNADFAYWAATLLGRLEAGAVQAVDALKTAAGEHPSDQVRKRATWALGKIASG